VERRKAWRLAEGLDVGDRSNVFHDLVRVPQGGVHTIEKATKVLSGGYPEHALDLALWTPPELIPPTARRLLSGVRHLVEAVDCGRLPEQLAVPKRKTEVAPSTPPPELLSPGLVSVCLSLSPAFI
jgi:hypothetical protein